MEKLDSNGSSQSQRSTIELILEIPSSTDQGADCSRIR
jgi:hypothetical protein